MSYHDGYRDGLKDAGQDAGRNAKLVVLLSVLLALAGLAGMYADLVKKTAFHGHPLDRVKARQMVGEIGRLQKQALAWLDRRNGGEV